MSADPTQTTTSRLADSVSRRGVGLAYGDTRTIDGVELVPVAFVTYGFGASDEPTDDQAAGGGGGGMAVPFGAYVGGPNGLRFRPNTIVVLTMSVLVISAVGSAIARIVKAAR